MDEGKSPNLGQSGGIGDSGIVGDSSVTAKNVLYTASHPHSVVVDDTTVYWTEQDLGSVMKASKTGGATPEQVAQVTDSPAGALALDQEVLYWISGDAINGRLRRVSINGGDVASLGVARPLFDIRTSITFDDENVYWTDVGDLPGVDGNIWKVSKQGGLPVAVQTFQRNPGSVVVDGGNIYWIEEGTAPDFADGVVYVSTTAGGVPLALATAQNFAGDLEVDSTNLYWVVRSPTSTVSVQVVTVPKAGGQVTVVSGFYVGEPRLATDSANLYATGDTVLRIAKDGSSTARLFEGFIGSFGGLTVDSTSVYFVNTGDSGGLPSIGKINK